MAAGGLDAAAASLAALVADGPEIPTGVLVDRMRELVRLRAMVDAALAEQLAGFDQRAGARYDGQTSTRAWLAARLGLGGQAGDLLLVARWLGGLPQASKAFAAGEITLEHAAAIARLASQVGAEQLADYEPVLLELARQVPPGKLRVACAHLRQLLDPDLDAAARQRRRRFLAAARTVDGMVHLQGLLDAGSGDVVLAALAAAMPVPTEWEERTVAQRRADALAEVCAGWLATAGPPPAGGPRPQVQVTVSLRTLRSGQPTTGGAAGELAGDVPVLADQTPVDPAEARQIACDARIIPVVLGGDSEPLDIGRASRSVPAGLRRALQLRDGGCRFAGCDRPASWCDAHHIVHWADGGRTSLSNLLLLCRWHHTLIHEGWRLHGDPQGTVRFHRPDRTRLDLTSTPRGRPPTRGP